MTNVCIIATIVIYLVGMLLVGFAYSKSNEDSTDFYLGGRKMGPLVTAMSAEASLISKFIKFVISHLFLRIFYFTTLVLSLYKNPPQKTRHHKI